MDHDTLAKRLGIILTRLNTGESLSLANLSQEFNVTERTLQRDFNERLAYLPIERNGSKYYLDPKYLGRLGKSDIRPILEELGLSTIFPFFDALSFSRLANKQTPPFLYKNLKVEDVSPYKDVFKLLTNAIQNSLIVSFNYEKRSYLNFHPYRLINDSGCWYLAGMHEGSIKLFRMTRLDRVTTSKAKFVKLDDIEEQIKKGNHIWLSDKPVELVLKIDAIIAKEFLDREILPEQNVLKVLDDGTLLLTSKIDKQESIIPILRYWLPNIEILSPLELKHSILQDLYHSIEKILR